MSFPENLVVTLIISGFSVFATNLFAAPTAERAPMAAASSLKNTADGAKVYAENCAICHGDSGDGNTRAQSSLRPPPRNFTTVAAALELTRERMIHSVTLGRPGTGMMAHKDRLTEAEIEAVVDYIRGKFMTFPEDKGGQELVKHVEGEKIYSKYCSVCHGDKGNTAVWAKSGLNPQPRDFTTAQARKDLTRERMITSVTDGRPGTAMMPHKDKLSAKEIGQVVDYIRVAFMSGPVAVESQIQPEIAAHLNLPQAVSPRMQGHPQMPGFSLPESTPSPSARANPHQQDPHQGAYPGGVTGMTAPMGPVASVDMNVPMPKGLRGNVQHGRKFYMNNCFTCHGVNGDGNGPRAHFNTPRPRNFTSEASRRMLNRERIFNSITNGKVGTVMPAWGKVLDDQQIANIAEFVFTAFIEVKKSELIDKDTPIQQASLNKKKAN
jgi:mono/diheme cytochrome c family protein